MKRFYFIISTIIIVIIVLGAILIVNWVRPISAEAAAGAEFTAIVEDEAGVDTGSAFQISFNSEVSSASVLRALTVTPDIEIGVHQGTSGSEVLIAPAEPLEPGTVYTFSLQAEQQTLQWAVQTKQELLINKVTPADHSKDVDTSASIDIVFNQMAEVDLSRISDYIIISPEISGSFEQQGRVLRFIPETPLAENTVYNVEIKEGLPLANSDIVLNNGMEFSFETVSSETPLWALNSQSVYLTDEKPTFTMALAANTTWADLDDDEITVNIYRFDAAENYKNTLIDIFNSWPSWSNGFKYLGGVNLAHTTQVGSSQLAVDNSEHNFVFELSYNFTPGYYLLRCEYAGQSRDVLFAISDIAAYIQSYASQTIFWLHDSNQNEPLSAQIFDENSTAVANTDDNGLAVVNTSGDAVYAIKTDGQLSLVIPYYADDVAQDNTNTNWRYLYLDQSSYQSGDTLNFWGMVAPRDGTKLKYDRVSVYIYSSDYSDYIYKEYADLANGVFSGSIILPTLLDGEYRLEITQSNEVLISQHFYIGAAVTNTTAQQQEDNVPELLTLDKKYYNLGDSFTATMDVAGSDYLFIEHNAAEVDAYYETDNSYNSIFTPVNQLNSAVSSVAYANGDYIVSQEKTIKRDYTDNILTIELSGNLRGERSGETGTLEINITDAAGNPVAADIAVNIVSSETMPNINTWAYLFEDSNNVAANTADINSLFFSRVRSDDSGYTECQYSLPEFSGDCWLIVQAISNDDTLKAGNTVLSFGQGSQELETGETAEEINQFIIENAQQINYEIGKLTDDTTLSSDSVVTIFGSLDRLEILGMLFEQIINYDYDAPENNDSAEMALAAAHARQLLLDYGGDYLSGIIMPTLPAGFYQKDDGGIGNLSGESSLATSAKAVAVAPSNIDYYALTAYYNSFLNHFGPDLDYSMALTGLAVYGYPVLNDIKIMLNGDNITDEEYLWLLWGLYASGDRENATAKLAEFLTDKDTLDSYSAGLAAILSALCGIDDPIQWLNVATENGEYGANLEQVLTARNLLPQLQQPQSSFSYSSGDEEMHTAIMQGINDYILKTATPEQVSFSAISGEIYYLDIFVTE